MTHAKRAAAFKASRPFETSAASRAEYLARIHRVMDHIERHLDRTLTLEELAAVACFSPFHFHRLFTANTGESLHRFILRLRLQRAASQLIRNSDKSITAVAFDCGFGSSAAFARAFRSAFGVSASRFRAGDRKKRQTDRKGGQDRRAADPYDASIADATNADGASARRLSMTAQSAMQLKEAQSVRIEDIGPMPVAYVRHVGPYAGNTALFGRLFERLCRWAGPRGFIGPHSKFLTVYHDDPEVADEDKLRISACVTVPDGTRGEGEVGTMTVDGGRYAVAHFELDASEYAAAWSWLMGVWLPASGYQPDDRPCFELMLNDPATDPQGRHIVEIWTPVRPL